MLWRIKFEDLEFIPFMEMHSVITKDRSDSNVSVGDVIIPLVSILIIIVH